MDDQGQASLTENEPLGAKAVPANAGADPRVVAWYERKTSFFLEKYSGAERIHYHTGLVPPGERPASSVPELKQQMWRAQEAMLERAAQAWDADRHLRGRLLDVGCGFGGGPIFWAQRYGTDVTALTPVPRHLPIIAECARRGGVADRIRPMLGDAYMAQGDRVYDAAIATGSSCYFDRRRWFARLANLIRPGGRVFIEDTFVGREEMRAPFNDYWIANVGTRQDYVDAAEAHGFRLVSETDVTEEAAWFWPLSVAYSHLWLESGGLVEADMIERRRSIEWQGCVHRAYLDRGYFDLLLHFQKVAE